MTITGSSSGDEIGFREVVRVDGHCSCDEVAARFISTLGKSFGHETYGEKQHGDKNDGAMCTRSDHGRWWRVSPHGKIVIGDVHDAYACRRSKQ